MTADRLTIDVNELSERLSLSPEQRTVLGVSGRGTARGALVAAGAGSGKTTTLVASLCNDILVDGVAPEEILVVTFTRAAAANLLSRSAQYLSTLGRDSGPLQDLWIGTIDAVCSRLLREDALAVGMPLSFAIGSDRDLLPLRQKALEAALLSLEREELLLLAERFDVSDGFFLKTAFTLYERLRLDGTLTVNGVAGPLAAPPEDFPLAEKARLAAVLDLLEADEDAMSKKHLPNKVRDCRAMLVSDDPRLMKNFSHGLRAGALSERANEAKELALAYKQHLVDARTYPLRRAVESLLVAFDQSYWEEKRRLREFDFLDLSLLVRDEVVRAGRGRRFKRVYIDEAQDTNALQLEILEGLLAEDGLLLLVGDENQSIYAFRQADVANFRRYGESPDLEQLTLGDNYRSQPLILKAVDAVFGPPAGAESDEADEETQAGELERLISMVAKSEIEESPFSTPVQLLVLTSDAGLPTREAEAAAFAPHVNYALDILNQDLTADESKLSYGDVGLLCETNRESRAYADALRALGIPTLLIQKKGLAEVEECRDLIAYLRLLADPSDETALLRVLTSPFVGVPPSDLEPLYRRLNEGRGRREEQDTAPVDRWAVLAAELPVFVSRYQGLYAARDEEGVADLARLVCEAHDFDLALELLDPTGARWRNVEKMLTVISDVERDYDGPSLRTVLARLEDEAETQVDEGQDASLPPGLDAVRVMTVHNAKGDEFPITVVARLGKRRGNPGQTGVKVFEGQIGMTLGADMSDSTFVLADEYEKAVDSAEERRLYYVAMTRAKRHLMLVASAAYDGDNDPKWSGPAEWLVPKLLAGTALPPPGDESLVATGEALINVVRLEPVELADTPEFIVTESDEEAPLPVVALPLGNALPALSYSAVTPWDKCSLRGHLALKGLANSRLKDVPGYAADGLDGLMGATRFGTLVHRLLKSTDFASTAPLRVVPALSELFPDPESRARAEQFLDLLDTSPLRAELQTLRIVGAELNFDLLLAGYLMGGTMDLLARGDTEALVVDWKTGSVDEFEEGYGFQRRLYALAVLRDASPPERVRAVTFHADGTQDREEFTLADVEALVGELSREVRRVVSTSLSHPTVGYVALGPHCEACAGLGGICPLAAARAGA
jgi:ATP-dependent helicase/nuclease subunit A